MEFMSMVREEIKQHPISEASSKGWRYPRPEASRSKIKWLLCVDRI